MTQHLKGLRVAILLTDGFEQVEMTQPRAALDKEGAKTFLVSPKEDTVQGWNHYTPADTFPVDVHLPSANPDDFDALLLPGGVVNPDTLRLNKQAIDFIRTIGAANKPIAAICHGPWTLINADLVRGHTMTSWPSLQVDLTNAGATWVDKEVVRDGKLVTSRKPADIPAFNPEMIRLFSNDTYTISNGDHHNFSLLALLVIAVGIVALYQTNLSVASQKAIAGIGLVGAAGVLGHVLIARKFSCKLCLAFGIGAALALCIIAYKLLPLIKNS